MENIYSQFSRRSLHWLNSEVYCSRGPHWPHSSTLTMKNIYSKGGAYTGYIQRSTVPEAHTGHTPWHLLWRIFVLKKEPTLVKFRNYWSRGQDWYSRGLHWPHFSTFTMEYIFSQGEATKFIEEPSRQHSESFMRYSSNFDKAEINWQIPTRPCFSVFEHSMIFNHVSYFLISYLTSFYLLFYIHVIKSKYKKSVQMYSFSGWLMIL